MTKIELSGRGRNQPGGDAAQEAHGGEEKELKPQAEVKVMKSTEKKGRSARRRQQCKRQQKVMEEMDLKFPKNKYKRLRSKAPLRWYLIP